MHLRVKDVLVCQNGRDPTVEMEMFPVDTADGLDGWDLCLTPQR